MKRILTLLPLLLLAASLHAQIVNIPDANFKNALIASNCVDTNDDGIPDSDADLNNDGEIQVSEATAAPNLYLNQKFIASMEGLQSFVNIEILECSVNSFSTVDLSQNVNLHTIVCNFSNDLTALDLSNNLLLTYLSCYQNPNLASLNVTQNTNLEYLNCADNQLTSLDVSQNLMLVELQCQYGLLQYVDVTNNLNLTHFKCGSDALMQVDVTQNVNLLELSIDGGHMTSLDLSQNTNLIFLHFGGGDLTSIDFSQNTALEEVWLGFSRFPTIDFSNNPNLQAITGDFSEFIELDLSQNPNLVFLSLYSNPLTSLDIKNGNNLNLWYFRLEDNPDLPCIQVDDEEYANNNPDWRKDPATIYSEDCELNVEDFQKSQVVVYPNPVNNSLFIDSEFPVEGEFSIIDSQGRIITTIPASNVIDVSQLTTGMYFLKFSSEGSSTTLKFIKE